MSLAETAEDTMSDSRSHEDRVADLVGLLNVVTAALVGVIGEVIRAGAWQGFGIRSPEHWVVWRCGVSPGRARRLVRIARALDALPATSTLFQAGSLGEDQTALIVRHTDAEHDAQVAELAPSLTVPQLRRVLPSVPRNEPDPPDDQGDDDESDVPDARCRRSVRFAHGDDGMWWCSVRLPSDQGALVQKALEVGRDHEFRLRHPDRKDAGHGGDPADVSWADGLLRLAHAGLDALDVATTAGRPPGERTQVILHLDADRIVPPRLHLGPVLPPNIGDYLSCDASVRYLLLRHGRPIAMGRRERTVGARLRTVIEHRDGGCRVPGCDQARWLHIHHLRHWKDGGRTDSDNLFALCPAHHRMVHQGLLTIEGEPAEPGGLTFADDRGRRLEPARPRRPSPEAPSAHAAHELGLPAPKWQHPPGEPLDTRWITWN
jgi:Domain of unknown function (DUF222)/HNH endonuclease